MAVKHKVVECVEQPQVETNLTSIIRVLQQFNELHNLQETDRSKLCEHIVKLLGTLAIPTKLDDYVKFMISINNFQTLFVQRVCANEDMIFATLTALYNVISDPVRPPLPTTSIVLQLISVEYIPIAVKYIIQSANSEQNLETALKTLCGWLSCWTLTPNLGPLVLHFMQGLAADQHFEILVEVTVTYIERLFNLLVLVEPRPSVEPVVIHMLSNMQHSPEAFHKIIPHANQVFSSLHQERSGSSLKCMETIINLCVALMNHFPGYKSLYEELVGAVEKVSCSLNYTQRLNCNSWASEATFATLTQTTLGRVGLNNLGNTCYMNSVLQALFMTKMFRNDVLSTNREMLPLFSSLQILFAMLQHSHRSSLSPNKMLNLARPPGFQPGHQHDSAEFLGYLLDVLHEQERSVYSIPIEDGPAPGPSNAVGHHPTATIVQRSFGGRTVTISRCGTCDTQSQRADNFWELSLSFPNNSGNHSVQTLLDYFLQPDKLCEDNQYHCDTCHGLTDGERVTRVEVPPARLVLTIKHFSYDPSSQQRTKLFQNVKHDTFLHLEHAKYELYAAVVHVGSTPDSGHYYTYARDKGDWYRFNDCLVTRTTAEQLCCVKPPETPYILFYSKQDCMDPDPLPKNALSNALQDMIVTDNYKVETDRRRRPNKTSNAIYRRNDEPPPPGCGGSSFTNSNSNRFVC